MTAAATLFRSAPNGGARTKILVGMRLMRMPPGSLASSVNTETTT